MLSADMVARGFVIYNNLATAANKAKNEVERTRLAQKAASIAQDISVMGTVGGQISQAFRILKQLNPEMRYYTLQRAVNKLQDRVNQQYGKDGAPKIEIDKQLAANWMQAFREDSELAAQYEQLLFEQIATQVPKLVSDYINAWRYLSMLGNPKTLIRNGVGNAAMIPVVMLKRQFGAAGEAIAQRLGKMDKSERTKSLGFVSATKEGRALLKYAADDILSSDVEAKLVDVYKMNPEKATQISKRLTGVSKDSEKYSIVNSTKGLSDNEKWTVIKALNDTDDAALAKINTISSAGVSVGEYIAYLDNRPESKSGTKTKWSKSKLKQWLSSEVSYGRLTRSAANALWHITDKNWTNDPF